MAKARAPRKGCTHACIARLFRTFAETYPRLAVYDMQHDTLTLRDIPEDESAQDRMHNDCMAAMRLTLKAASEARVTWMSAAALKRESDDGDGGRPRRRRRAGE